MSDDAKFVTVSEALYELDEELCSGDDPISHKGKETTPREMAEDQGNDFDFLIELAQNVQITYYSKSKGFVLGTLYSMLHDRRGIQQEEPAEEEPVESKTSNLVKTLTTARGLAQDKMQEWYEEYFDTGCQIALEYLDESVKHLRSLEQQLEVESARQIEEELKLEAKKRFTMGIFSQVSVIPIFFLVAHSIEELEWEWSYLNGAHKSLLIQFYEGDFSDDSVGTIFKGEVLP